MKWAIGDKLRVLDASKIDGGDFLTNRKNYEVIDVSTQGRFVYIADDDGDDFRLAEQELLFVEHAK